MAALVTLADAKVQCKIPASETALNGELNPKIDQASAIILDYLKSRGDPTWTPLTVPEVVKCATLILVAHLFEHRGEDQRLDEGVWDSITRILIRSRDPALA